MELLAKLYWNKFGIDLKDIYFISELCLLLNDCQEIINIQYGYFCKSLTEDDLRKFYNIIMSDYISLPQDKFIHDLALSALFVALENESDFVKSLIREYADRNSWQFPLSIKTAKFYIYGLDSGI